MLYNCPLEAFDTADLNYLGTGVKDPEIMLSLPLECQVTNLFISLLLMTVCNADNEKKSSFLQIPIRSDGPAQEDT